jgi:hypothetical protein
VTSTDDAWGRGLSLVSVLLCPSPLPESLPREQRETAPIHVNALNPYPSIGAMARKLGLGWLLLYQFDEGMT